MNHNYLLTSGYDSVPVIYVGKKTAKTFCLISYNML